MPCVLIVFFTYSKCVQKALTLNAINVNEPSCENFLLKRVVQHSKRGYIPICLLNASVIRSHANDNHTSSECSDETT